MGEGGGGFGMTPWCDDLVCSWRRLLADHHSLPFPWTLSLHWRWCPSASHHPVTSLFLPALTAPLPRPFLSLGLSLHRPRCPSASHHSFPSFSLGRLEVGGMGGGGGAKNDPPPPFGSKIMNLLVFFSILSRKSVSGSRLHGCCMGQSGTSAHAVYSPCLLCWRFWRPR